MNTKNAIAISFIRTKLGGILIEPGHKFEDLADRIDNLIAMGAASPVDDLRAIDIGADPWPESPQVDALLERPTEIRSKARKGRDRG